MTSCLTYLQSNGFGEICEKVDEATKKRKEFPFLNYAADNWGPHAFTVQSKIHDMALAYLLDDQAIARAICSSDRWAGEKTHHVFSLRDRRRRAQPLKVLSLQYIAYYGLSEVLLAFMMKCKEDVDTPLAADARLNWSLFKTAFQRGRAGTIAALIESGLDPSKECREVLLVEASASGQVEMVNLLLMHDTQPNVRSKGFPTPAIWREGEQQGLTLEQQGWNSYLSARLPNTDAEILAELLPMPWPNPERTPLIEAVREGHQDTAQALLNAGADVNSVLGDGMPD